MAKKLEDLYCEVSGNQERMKAFAEAAKAGKVADFVKANGVEASEEEIRAFKAGKTPDETLSVDELANAAGGETCSETCDHEWVVVSDFGGCIPSKGKPWVKRCTKCGKEVRGVK